MRVAARLQMIGWDEQNIDLRCNLTVNDIQPRLNRFLTRLQDSQGALAVFYFAGHGVQVGSQNYIFGVNARPNIEAAARSFIRSPKTYLFADDAIEINWYLIDRLGGDYSNAVLLMLDACRENPLYDRLCASSGPALCGRRMSQRPVNGIPRDSEAPGGFTDVAAGFGMHH
jgi:hypothetical protein